MPEVNASAGSCERGAKNRHFTPILFHTFLSNRGRAEVWCAKYVCTRTRVLPLLSLATYSRSHWMKVMTKSGKAEPEIPSSLHRANEARFTVLNPELVASSFRQHFNVQENHHDCSIRVPLCKAFLFWVIWGGCSLKGSSIFEWPKQSNLNKSLRGSIFQKYVYTCFIIKMRINLEFFGLF